MAKPVSEMNVFELRTEAERRCFEEMVRRSQVSQSKLPLILGVVLVLYFVVLFVVLSVLDVQLIG